MKIYRNLCLAITEILHSVFTEGKYADRIIPFKLKENRKWGSRDRRFIAGNAYEIVRYFRLYDEILGSKPHNYWRILGVHLIVQGIDLPDFEEFESLNPPEILSKLESFKETPRIRESIPDWLDLIGSAELKEKWLPTLCALNESTSVVLRVNTLKTNREELQKSLSLQGINTVPKGQDGLILEKRRKISHLPEFNKGWFEIQDYSSQQVGEFTQVQPGMTVIDACAGAGGKTLHLAAMMKNKGRIISMDVESNKLNELFKRAKRAGVKIVEALCISSDTISKHRQLADRVLLDVPCSGLGVLKRNPDAKWKLSKDFLNQIRVTQEDILNEYSIMVKKDGKLIYATCSILPSENQDQVARFLKNNTEQFELEEQRIVLPQDEGFDGFYMARLRKIG